MGNSCCQEAKLKRQKIALLLVGLDNAGKTVTAKGLAGEALESPIPTVGFSVIKLKHHNSDVKIFDLGGGSNIRGIWHKYFVDVHGVIFVVDSSDSERFPEARQVLRNILSNPKISGKPLLILANKQDQETALDEIDLIENLSIEELVNEHRCPTLVQSCRANELSSSKIDLGIRTGYEWIIDYISNHYQELDVRVQMDVIEQDIEEKQELLLKMERIKAERALQVKSEDPDAIQTFSEYVSSMNGTAPNHSGVLDSVPFRSTPILDESDSNKSSDSSITFPDIYYVNRYSSERNRPKSAVQIVSRQLQMNKQPKQSAKVRRNRNRTVPMEPLPAKEFIPKTERDVRSAKEGVFTISGGNVGPAGDFYVPSTAPVDRPRKMPPLKVKSRAQINREAEMNGICVVDVE